MKKIIMETMQRHVEDTIKYFSYQEQPLKIEYLKRAMDIADGIKTLADNLRSTKHDPTFERLYLDFVFAITNKIEEVKEQSK